MGKKIFKKKYLSEEGYIEMDIEKDKENDDYIIVIQIKDKWNSTVVLENFISQNIFQNILLNRLKYFIDDFYYIFP